MTQHDTVRIRGSLQGPLVGRFLNHTYERPVLEPVRDYIDHVKLNQPNDYPRWIVQPGECGINLPRETIRLADYILCIREMQEKPMITVTIFDLWLMCGPYTTGTYDLKVYSKNIPWPISRIDIESAHRLMLADFKSLLQSTRA